MIFISYSSKEAEKAYALKRVLVANGVECWMAPESIPSGSDYATEIPAAIKKCDAFVLLLSTNAQDSKWVPKELDCAITNAKTILPFHVDDSAITDAFDFRLSNVQRIEAYNRMMDAYKELIISLHRILGITNQQVCVEFEESLVKTKVPQIVELKPEEVKFKTCIFDGRGFVELVIPSQYSDKDVSYDFAEESEACIEAVKGVVAELELTDRKMVQVSYRDSFKKTMIRAENRKRRIIETIRYNFDISFIGGGEKNGYSSSHLSVEKGKVDLSMFKGGDYVFKTAPEDAELDYYGINEKTLIDACHKLVAFCCKNENVQVDNKFRKIVYSDKSGHFELRYIV